MSYDYRYINKQIFPNSVGYTLLLEDSDNEELIRIEKCFMFSDDYVDNEFLRNEAKKEIKRVLTDSQVNVIVEISPDDALSE